MIGALDAHPRMSLRQDLCVFEGPKIDLAPTWMLYDPPRHRYFQIDGVAFAVISMWDRALSVTDLFRRVNATGRGWIGAQEVERVVDFAATNELVEETARGWRIHLARAEAARSSLLMWLVHNYLFIKIPVVRPRDFFERTAYLVGPIFTRAFLLVTVIAALLGLYLVSRQWDTFVGTFPSFFSFEGAVVYGATILGVKACHELGHAYTAGRYKCHVSSIGVAFLVMLPMLYCDVTDSWKLADRRKRLVIDVAGIAVELVLAVYASLAWVFIPDGLLRTAAFLVASTSIVSSIALNLNPFMRFDGYLMLADAMNVPNLQARAFGLFRWKLRELLFGLGERCPEDFGPTKRAGVLIYAGAIIVYRAIVYTGIAILVYHAFFKMLGIALFAVEIGWFIVAPVVRELVVWWKMRSRVVLNHRTIVTGSLALLGVVVFLFPFRTSVVVPAILEPASFERVFPPAPGQVISIAVHAGDPVTVGQVIATLTSPRLDQEARIASIKLDLVNKRLQRGTSLAQDKAETLSLGMEKQMLLDKLAGIDRERRDMTLKSPIDGLVQDINPKLVAGRWIGRDEEIALVTTPARAVVRGYLRQSDLDKVAEGDVGTFYPDAIFARSVPASLTQIAYSATDRLDIPYLSSLHGGTVPAREAPDRAEIPDTTVYPVTFAVETPPAQIVRRGIVRLEGRRESFVLNVIGQIRRVLLRESGF